MNLTSPFSATSPESTSDHPQSSRHRVSGEILPVLKVNPRTI
ncbi:hypothetical protein V6Z12_D12G155300 [Gossypium hirsutum]